MKLDKRKFWMCLSPLLAGLTDYALTIMGQGPKYWSGNYSAVREAAPHARWLLLHHPAMLIGAAALYILAYCAFIVLLPVRISKTLVIALVIGHCWGVATWFQYYFNGYWSCILYFILCAALIAYSFELADRKPTIRDQSENLPGN